MIKVCYISMFTQKCGQTSCAHKPCFLILGHILLQYTYTTIYIYYNIHILQYTYTTIYIYYNIHILQYTYTTIYIYYNIHILQYTYTTIKHTAIVWLRLTIVGYICRQCWVYKCQLVNYSYNFKVAVNIIILETLATTHTHTSEIIRT